MPRRKQPEKDYQESENSDEMDIDEEEEEEEEEEIAPVVERKRGRPPKKSLPKKEKLDDDMQSDDEIDPVGEEKVTKDGYLLGGREYRFQTFTLGTSSELYLFSLDASKLLGFRDTYIFFLRNPRIKRITGTEEDREHLRGLRILPSQLRNRPIILIKARNLFKVFGHKVVRRGRPVRDDYYCDGIEEPAFNEETRAEEDEQSFAIYDYQRSNFDGGPFRRHGISILGYKSISVEDAYEPINVFDMDDAWMQKCAASCAEFNARNRPSSFLDLHTNIEQIQKKTQPTRIRVQVKKSNEKLFKINKETTTTNVDDAEWEDVVQTSDGLKVRHIIQPTLNGISRKDEEPIVILDEENKLYPLAIMRDQYQSQFSLYPYRFNDQDVPKQIPTRQEPFDMPPTLLGTQPYLPADALVTKRHRQKKMEIGYDDTFEICVHCHETEAPTEIQGFSNAFTLTCSKCSTKHHPSCIEFSDKALIAKCATYAWVCTNCKVCESCTQTGHDDQLMFCDVCDRATHMFCLNPPLEKLPTGVWVCKQCAVCTSCKTTNGKWCHVVNNGDFICTYCKDCYHEFINDRFCPFCLETFTQDDEVAMVCCDQCERWVHVDCEPALDHDKYQKLVEVEEPTFVCTLCSENQFNSYVKSRTDPFTKVLEYKGNNLLVPPEQKN